MCSDGWGVTLYLLSGSCRYFCCFLQSLTHEGGMRSGSLAGVECHSPSSLTDSLTLYLSSVCVNQGVKELRWKMRKCWGRSVGCALGAGTTHRIWFRHLSHAE